MHMKRLTQRKYELAKKAVAAKSGWRPSCSSTRRCSTPKRTCAGFGHAETEAPRGLAPAAVARGPAKPPTVAMIRAFRGISLRHFMTHKLRTLLTFGGIALGVAIVVAMRLMHQSVSSSYERTVAKIAGKAAIEITNGDGGVPEELLDEVKHVPGVKLAAASVQGFVSLPRYPGDRLYVFGIDLLADQELRDYQYGSESAATIDDPLVFLAAARLDRDLEGVPRSLPAWRSTTRSRSSRRAGGHDLKVRASLETKTGPATLFAGRFAVMDVFRGAAPVRSRSALHTQIDVGLADGAELATVNAGRCRARRQAAASSRNRGRAGKSSSEC